MFNIFKKKPQIEVQEQVTVMESPSKYSPEIEQIHNEFYTVGDKILEECKAVLKELESKDLIKGKKLASLGFTNTREATNAKETEAKLISTKEMADKVIYFQKNYPFNKFITENQVTEICKKYGLVCGDVSAYKGFVPEVKLQEIDRFKLKKEDIPEVEVENKGFTTMDKVRKTFIEHTKRGEWCYTEFVNGQVNLEGGTEKWGKYTRFRVLDTAPTFKICAPLKDMELNLGQKIKDHRIIDIPDPIVLQPVDNGFLIVSCLGPESSDPIVVNEKSN